MFVTSKAIVLHSFRFSDRASIVHFYTEAKGRLTCITYGNRNAKSGNRNALLQPLSIVEIEIEMAPGKELPVLKEIRSTKVTTSLSLHPVKNAVSLFLAEFLFRTLREMQADRVLYRFLEESIGVLNDTERGPANFHLVMLLQMTRFLGFYPNLEHQMPEAYFDLLNGVFCLDKPAHNHFLSPESCQVFVRLMRIDYRTMHLFSFSRAERVEVLGLILDYYRIHLSEFGELKSLPVLMEIFD
jgi:DNA repair protein RecO (recombination protein O)